MKLPPSNAASYAPVLRSRVKSKCNAIYDWLLGTFLRQRKQMNVRNLFASKIGTSPQQDSKCESFIGKINNSAFLIDTDLKHSKIEHVLFIPKK